jgi:hypothetical protein
MLNSSLSRSVSPPSAPREVAPPTYRDHAAATVSHAFSTPVVREIVRPAPEPLSFATTW